MSKLYSDKLIQDLLDDSVTITEFKSKLSKLTEDDYAVVDTVKVEEDDTITIMFPESYIDEIGSAVKYLQDTYPNNPVIAIIDNMDMLIQNADDALEMLDGMKNKISILKDTPADKKIIVQSMRYLVIQLYTSNVGRLSCRNCHKLFGFSYCTQPVRYINRDISKDGFEQVNLPVGDIDLFCSEQCMMEWLFAQYEDLQN